MSTLSNKYYIYLASLSHLVNDTAQGALPALLPLFISTYGLTYQEAAGLMFANTILASIFQPLFGHLADKKPMPWLMPLGICLSGGSVAAMYYIHSYMGLFFLAMASGCGSAIFHPEGARLVNRMSGAKKGRDMSLFAVGGSGGFAVGPLLAGLVYLFSPAWLFIFFIINALVAIPLCLFVVFAPTTPAQTNATMVTSSPTTSPTTDTSLEKSSTSNDTVVTVEKTNDWASFLRLSVIIVTRSLIFASMNTFIPIYWVSVLHQEPTAANFALTTFFFIGVVVNFVGGILADRIGFVRIIRYSYILLVPFMLLFTNTTNLWLSFMLLFPVAFGLFAQFSPLIVMGQTYLAKSVGFAAGITLGVGITLGGILAPCIGWLADRYGLIMALQVLNIITIVGLIYSYRLKEE